MEKATLNIDNLYISQGMNGTYSHKGNLAIDLANCIYLKAPFTGVIKKKYDYCNAVWLESIEKVEFADGTIDYMTVLTMHDNNINDLKVGQIIKKGEVYYHPGVKGNVTGTHIHMCVGKGKFTGSGWYQNAYGKWCVCNQYDITKALFLNRDVKISKGIYNWKTVSSTTKTVEELAKEVIKGLWGNVEERKNRLTSSGYDYNSIQKKVNEMLNTSANITYTVQKGDTLWGISQKFGINLNELYQRNKHIIGDNPNLIYIGQILQIK